MATAPPIDFDPGARDAFAPQFPPGTIAPKEGPIALHTKPAAAGERASLREDRAPSDLGPNNERLEELRPRCVAALRQMIIEYRMEGIVSRRHEIRRIRQARLFWQGLQYGWWNPNDMSWHLPFGASGVGGVEDAQTAEDMPRYQFVTNFYQGFGLSFIAIMSQDVPTTRFYPQSTQSEQDITTAKAADHAVELIEQNNRVQDLLTGIGYLLWTDGKIGGYVRYVADGQRFGFHDQNEMEETILKMGEDEYVCAQCGAATPATDFMAGSVCPECGAELGDENLRPADLVPVPRITGTRRVPNGQEVISIIGGLEFHTPVWANEMHEFPYLQWQQEVHRAKLKASYPHVADKIETGGPIQADDVYARASRVAVQQGLPVIHPGDALYNLITFSRTWIRPWSFYSIEDKDVREELLQLFPDGWYVAFAGETYCESRNESMEDHWRVMHALPGDGQNRPSVGDSLVQVQERYNNLSNLQMETFEFGIPPIYADPQVLDFDALSNQTAEPAAHYPARAKPGQRLADGFFQPPPASVPPELIKYRQDLAGPVPQFLTGLFPAIFGGEMEHVKTATGYSIARDQAMGRLGLVWRRLKRFYGDLMLLGVDCFRKNRPEDVEIPILGAGGEFQAKWIRLADLKGNLQVRDEEDEQFPRLKSQQRAVLQQLMNSPDPMIQQLMGIPANQELMKSIFGLTDIVVPGEESRIKQLREIDELLQGQPIMCAAADSGDPAGRAGEALPVQLLPSVPVDELLDDHEAEFAECKRWANSDAGQTARMHNPAGFANVRAHAAAHLAALGRKPGLPG